MVKLNYATLAAALGCCLVLSGCATSATPVPAPVATAAPTVTQQAAATQAPAAAPPPAPPAAATTPPAETSPAAARAVIIDFYAAINEHDYQRAYLHWGEAGGASQQTFEQFQAGYAATTRVEAEVGQPTDTNAGAGSSFTTIPVALTASQADGSVQTFQGAYVLRRVNDVPGSSAAQRRWHIERADIR